MARLTREKLLEAAKAEFFEKGWSATGLAIRVRAGVSQGSWAHFFPGGKEQVARVIYLELHADVWVETLDALEVTIGMAARPSLLKVVRSFLASVERQPDSWRLLFQLEHGLSQMGLKTQLTAEQQRLRSKVELWANWNMQSTKRRLPSALVFPITLGPALAAASDWLAGPREEDPTQWVKSLTDAAIASLEGVASAAAKLASKAQQSVCGQTNSEADAATTSPTQAVLFLPAK